MIKIKHKLIENVIVLKLEEGSYDELNRIQVDGLRGLGGFTIQETITYLLNTKDSGVVAYNFRNEEECLYFKRTLKSELKRINEGEKGLYKLKDSLI